MQTAKGYRNRCSTSLIIWEIQIKTGGGGEEWPKRAIISHPLEQPLSKRQEEINVGQDADKREPLGTVTMENSSEVPQKIEN